MQNWRVQKAVSDDADALHLCMTAAYAEYAARIRDLPSMTRSDCLADIDGAEVWVARDATDADATDAIAGALVLVPGDGFMQLANVAVHPDHRGTGLGRTLMTLAEDEAQRQGCRELRLFTHAEMPENVALYEHLGWQLIGRDENKIAMKKRL